MQNEGISDTNLVFAARVQNHAVCTCLRIFFHHKSKNHIFCMTCAPSPPKPFMLLHAVDKSAAVNLARIPDHQQLAQRVAEATSAEWEAELPTDTSRAQPQQMHPMHAVTALVQGATDAVDKVDVSNMNKFMTLLISNTMRRCGLCCLDRGVHASCSLGWFTCLIWASLRQ
jgi:hypothetical protein